MPLYEYYCAHCKTEFEALRPAAKADELVPCKNCGQPGQRQLSTFSFKSGTFTAPKLKQAGRPFRSHDREASANDSG